MKLTLSKQTLIHIAQQELKFISSKPQLPVLSCLLFDIKKTEVSISATDLQAGIRISVPHITEAEPTQFVCPAKMLYDFLQVCRSEQVEMELLSPTRIQVQAGKTKAVINSFPVEDYPAFPTVAGQEVSLPAKEMQQIAEKVVFAASFDETRPVLTSVYLHFDKDESQFVATDGYRLAFFRSQYHTSQPFTFLLPSKYLAEISKLLSQEKKEELKLILSEDKKQLFLQTNQTELVIRLIEGEYPTFKKIIPPAFSIKVEIPVAELADSVKAALLFSRDSSGIVKFTFAKDQLTISSQSALTGEYTAQITLSSPVVEDSYIAFNGKYVLEFLSKYEEETVLFQMNNPLKPGMFVDPKSPDYQYLVMPFRLNE